MIPALVSDDTIVQEIAIQAPAARIFEALTNPAQLLKWWASEGMFQVTHVECDLRIGGAWRMQVAGKCGPDASDSIVSGVYRTIEPPHVLEFTWNRENEDHPETLVRWDLVETGGATLVRVTHSGLTSETLRARNGGWPLIVKLLKSYAENPSRN